jgi:hypothetical protein
VDDKILHDESTQAIRVDFLSLEYGSSCSGCRSVSFNTAHDFLRNFVYSRSVSADIQRALLENEKMLNFFRTEPARLVTKMWSDHDICFRLRALLSITEQSRDLCRDSGNCLVNPGDTEMELHRAEGDDLADSVEHQEILRMISNNCGLQPGGMVDPGRWVEVKGEMRGF